MIKCLLPLVCLILTTAAQAVDIQAGRTKAAACVDCHGDNGRGDRSDPAIAGMAQEAFITAMREYQSGLRDKSRKMVKAARQVSEADLADLAAYYASLTKPAPDAEGVVHGSDSEAGMRMARGTHRCSRRGMD